MTSGSLWSFHKHKIDNSKDDASDGKSFKYKIRIVGITPAQPENERDANRPAVPTLNV